MDYSHALTLIDYTSGAYFRRRLQLMQAAGKGRPMMSTILVFVVARIDAAVVGLSELVGQFPIYTAPWPLLPSPRRHHTADSA